MPAAPALGLLVIEAKLAEQPVRSPSRRFVTRCRIGATSGSSADARV
jgi:hypothetical protein